VFMYDIWSESGVSGLKFLVVARHPHEKTALVSKRTRNDVVFWLLQHNFPLSAGGVL
jgi:hypothetical protein